MAKEGGPNPEANSRLRWFQNSKATNPKKMWNAIKKATDKTQ
jgi:transcriptional/translational regulatory protein YebC/TACO1